MFQWREAAYTSCCSHIKQSFLIGIPAICVNTEGCHDIPWPFVCLVTKQPSSIPSLVAFLPSHVLSLSFLSAIQPSFTFPRRSIFGEDMTAHASAESCWHCVQDSQGSWRALFLFVGNTSKKRQLSSIQQHEVLIIAGNQLKVCQEHDFVLLVWTINITNQVKVETDQSGHAQVTSTVKPICQVNSFNYLVNGCTQTPSWTDQQRDLQTSQAVWQPLQLWALSLIRTGFQTTHLLYNVSCL